MTDLTEQSLEDTVAQIGAESERTGQPVSWSPTGAAMASTIIRPGCPAELREDLVRRAMIRALTLAGAAASHWTVGGRAARALKLVAGPLHGLPAVEASPDDAHRISLYWTDTDGRSGVHHAVEVL